MIQAFNPATAKWHQEPAATESGPSGPGEVARAPHGSMMAKESAGPLARLRSVFSRRVSTCEMSFKPVYRVDLPSPAMKIVHVPPALRLSLFNELFIEVIRQHEDWGLVLDDGVPEAYASRPTISPSSNLLPRELISSTCCFYYHYSEPEDRHRPFYGHDYPELSDNTPTFQPLITRRSDELVAQGIALSVAVSVAINEYLDAMLVALDRIVFWAVATHTSLNALKLPLYSCIFQLAMCISNLFNFFDVREDIIRYYEGLTCDETSPECYGRLIIHSTDGHTFVELMESRHHTGRAIGLYPTTMLRPVDGLAPRSNETFEPPEPLQLVEDLRLSTTDILPASLPLATMAGFNGIYLALPDRSVTGALHHGFLSLGIPKLMVYLSTALETGIFDRRGQLLDEYKTFRGEPVSGVHQSFSLRKKAYQRVSSFLDEEIDRNRRGDLHFNGFSDNCMHFTQRVFERSGYWGQYTDYFPDYVRLSEKVLMANYREAPRWFDDMTGSIVLFYLLARFAISTGKVVARGCRWLWSGAVGKSVRDRRCKTVPQLQIPR